MIHKFDLWTDLLRPLLCKVVGHKYDCCDRIKNCTRCRYVIGEKE